MPALWTSTLNPQGPNYEDWLKILGTGAVPLISPRWRLAEVAGEKNVPIFLLNIRGLTLSQRARMVNSLAQRYNLSISEVETEIAKTGIPIRTADVIVSYSTRAFV
jgi:hypothetical protein